MILRRYMHQKILGICLPILFVLLGLFTSSVMIRYLSYAARGDVSIQYFPRLLLIELPALAGVLFPIAFFFSILIALNRLYVQNEWVALQSSGIGRVALVRIILDLALPCALLITIFMFWFQPYLMKVKANCLSQAKAHALMDMFQPGQFQTLVDHNNAQTQIHSTIYIDKINAARNHVQGVFMVIQRGKDPFPDLLLAKEGYQENKQGALYFVLKDATLYHGQPGTGAYRVSNAQYYQSLIRPKTVAPAREKKEALGIGILIQQYTQDLKSAAELQWRVSIPLMLIILAYLAVPLSYVPPKKEPYTNLIPAILLLLLYINGVLLLKNTVPTQKIGFLSNIWWLHSLFALIAFRLNRKIFL